MQRLKEVFAADTEGDLLQIIVKKLGGLGSLKDPEVQFLQGLPRWDQMRPPDSTTRRDRDPSLAVASIVPEMARPRGDFS